MSEVGANATPLVFQYQLHGCRAPTLLQLGRHV